MIKPKPLKKFDKVAIISLSSGMLGEKYCSHQIKIGIKRLKEMSLEPIFMKNTLKGIEYLKFNPKKRAEDLKDAFLNEEIKCIICAIGGNDGYKVLPYLMEDEEFIQIVKNNPKIFIGFSDSTVHHLMFYKIGIQSFYGISFLNDIAELDIELLPYTKKYIDSLFYEEMCDITSSDIWYEERLDFSEQSINTCRISHKEIRGFELLQGEGEFEGELLGGCLESIYDILDGNKSKEQKEICEKYRIFPSKIEWKNKILFIETCEYKTTPKQYEEMLLALKEREIFNVINAIIIGKPQDEIYYEEYKRVLLRVIDNKNLSVVYNVNFGHAYPHCILPYGTKVRYVHEERKIFEI